MKICQRCGNNVILALGPQERAAMWDPAATVPESECQFWAHQAFREFIKAVGWQEAPPSVTNAILEMIKEKSPETYEKLVKWGLKPRDEPEAQTG